MGGSVGSEDGDAGFQIAPMVDVVFVLMLFFMASAGSQVVENELNISLPSGAAAAPGSTQKTPIILDISAEGQVVGNNTSFGTPMDTQLLSLREWLKATQGFGGEDPVIIRPNSETKHERIIDVLNACAAAGITSVTFAGGSEE
jgi:biopolymer transport protein ExbD